VGILLSVVIDSHFWGRGREGGSSWVWPEGMVLFFNTVENKSREWGTHPWHWYASSALPRALLASPLLWPFCLLPPRRGGREGGRAGGKGRAKSGMILTLPLPRSLPLLELDLEPFLLLFLPIAAYLSLYSLLPHKELRFIFPALPVLNLCAAVGWARLSGRGEEGRKGKGGKGKSLSMSSLSVRFCCACLPGWGVMLLSLFTLPLFLAASRKNYPGGEGLRTFHVEIVPPLFSTFLPLVTPTGKGGGRDGGRDQVKLHIGVLAAQTGVSRFGEVWREGGRERGVDVVYDKEEGLSLLERMRRYDFLLLEKEEAEEAIRKREERNEGEKGKECAVMKWVEGLPCARRPKEILWNLRKELMEVAARLKGKSDRSSSSSSRSKTEGWENIFVKTEPVLALVICH